MAFESRLFLILTLTICGSIPSETRNQDSDERSKTRFLYPFIKRELETTLTDEKAIAAAAIAGFKSQPVKGYKIPAAIGMPTIL